VVAIIVLHKNITFQPGGKSVYSKEVMQHLRDNGLPENWHDLEWQEQLAWLKENADPNNEYHMNAWQGCMEMKYNVQ
jgi:3-hydroxy-3-methylglutaryl CoA synthase